MSLEVVGLELNRWPKRSGIDKLGIKCLRRTGSNTKQHVEKRPKGIIC